MSVKTFLYIVILFTTFLSCIYLGARIVTGQ